MLGAAHRHNGRMPSTAVPAFRVVFVCTGNICRSPMADAVFRRLIRVAGFDGRLASESAGTGDWHVGERADPRARTALAERGYDGELHRARQFDPGWFPELDLVVAFDRGQERTLRHAASSDEDRAKVALLRAFSPGAPPTAEVPDPYYSDARMFQRVLEMIERSCGDLFRQLEPGIRAV